MFFRSLALASLVAAAAPNHADARSGIKITPAGHMAPEKVIATPARMVSAVHTVTVTEDPGSNTVLIRATGVATSGGWSVPKLVARAVEEPPKDGILELEFVAVPPTIGSAVMAAISVETTVELPDWAVGVRVVAHTNAVERHAHR